MIRKKTEVDDDDIELPMPKAEGRYRELYDVLMGKASGKGLYNASGKMLGKESALLRVRNDGPYSVVMSHGDHLYVAYTIHPAAPYIARMRDRMTVFGPSPAERERAELAAKRARMTKDEQAEAEVELRRGWGLNVTTAPAGIPTLPENDRNHPGIKVL